MTRTLILAALLLLVAGAGYPQTAPAAGGPQAATPGPAFVDSDGDGICDKFQARAGQRRASGKKGYGPGDGTGNRGAGPRDGSGYGPGTGNGTGICPYGNTPGSGQGAGARGGRGPRR
jgi:hypothetical protein